MISTRWIALAASLAVVACHRPSSDERRLLPSPLIIRDPCADFVTVYEPDPSPKLIRKDGQLLLEVAFTPAAGYEEVDRMQKASKQGPVVARVEHTGREFIIQGPAFGGIMVYVDSLEHAEAILRDLCFQGGKDHLDPPP